MCSFGEKLMLPLSIIIIGLKFTFKSITQLIKLIISSMFCCFYYLLIKVNIITKTLVKYLKQLKNKVHLFSIIKFNCLLILVLSGLSVTLDYLSYPYIYKLIVSDNKYGFDLPAISVCTERHVFFDKYKVIQYFDLQQKYEEWEQNVSQNFQNQKIDCNQISVGTYWYDHTYWACTLLETVYNHNLSEFFGDYEKKIFESLSFDQMKNLTISANELFKCSAKLHFRYETFDSNSTEIPNCFQRFDVLESIYGNRFRDLLYIFCKELQHLSQRRRLHTV